MRRASSPASRCRRRSRRDDPKAPRARQRPLPGARSDATTANRRRDRRQQTDRGSASIWLIACATLVLLLGVALLLRETAVLARHRAETAADLAALAAAGRIGLDPDAATSGCALAARVAAANGAALVSCAADLALDGRSGAVDVAVRVPVRLPILGGGTASASARAGRLVPSPP